MQRAKVFHLYAYMWMLVLASARTRSQLLGSTTPRPVREAARRTDPSYFYMDVNGGYKYAFDTGRGFEGEQSADHTNEVTGHYTYYEKGVPYMVKYRAGVQGYQPEVLPRPVPAKPALAQYMQLDGGSAPAPLATHSASNIPTLQFVQDAMKTMQTRPLQVSFMSQQGHVPHGQPSAMRRALLAPVSSKEAHQINALAETHPPQQLHTHPQQQLQTHPQQPEAPPKRPYAFSYLSDQSAHSESADQQGNVLGKYSYYDEAGYHDVAYKAGDDIGFVILGGSLSQPKLPLHPLQMPHASYNYKMEQLRPAEANTIKHDDGRSLRKFRRLANW